MSATLKEWLVKTITELEEERDAVPGVVNEDAAMALAAMKIALASLEAESVISHVGSKNALDDIVAFIKSNRNPTLKDHNQVSERLFQDNCHGLSNHVIEYIKQIGEELEELRSTQDTAPPAPVAMKDHQFRELVNELRDIAVKYHGSQQLREHIARTIRAAMLQGADQAPVKQPSSNSIIGWLRADYQDDNRGVRGNAPLFVLGKKDPSSVWGIDYIPLTANSPVITDGWVMVPIEPTEHMIVEGFESEPDEFFSDAEVWEAYDAMSGCQQAAHRAKLCYAAMIAAAPKP